MVPGANGTPTWGFRLFSTAPGFSIGTVSFATVPLSSATAADNAGTNPRNATVATLLGSESDACPGIHVAAYRPWPTGSKVTSGSPFENAAFTNPFEIKL